MIDTKYFNDREKADIFYESIYDCFEYVSMMWTGELWKVSYGWLEKS